jgi:hypothetical protein
MQSNLSRLTGATLIAALLGVPLLPGHVWAQATPPPPPGAPAPATQAEADPPARVGRLAALTGTVSFHNPDDTEWSAATLNYPVVAGNSFWTQPDAQAELEFGDSRITMNSSTEFDLGALDNTGVTATLPQGEVFLHVRSLAAGETVTLQTPRGAVTVAAPGDYGIAAGDTENPTVITVISGAAQVAGTSLSLSVAPRQAATITGTDTFVGSVGPAQPDPFLSAMLARNLPSPVAPAAVPSAVATLPGGEDLAMVGTWQTAPDYGQVWYPPVPAGWVPYRNGHWAYILPWGWTWVDDAPWGFAPFHYGRWAFIGNRWGWVPGVEVAAARPVYAPALVAFFGVGVGVGVAIGGSVGWCPLGPGEAYHPWYHATDRYVRAVNPRITNITTVNNVTINNYHNGRFSTVVPAETLATSNPVARSVVAVSAQQLASTRPALGRDPVRPTIATVGVTPGVARQLQISRPAGVVARPAAPGPVVHATTPFAPGHPVALPMRSPATPAVARPPGTTQPIMPPAITPRPITEPHTEGAPAPHPTEPSRPPEAPRPVVVQPGVQPPRAQPPVVFHPAPAPHPGTPVLPQVQYPVAPHPEPIPRPVEPPPHAAPEPRPAPAPPPRVAPPPQPHPAPPPREEKKPEQR